MERDSRPTDERLESLIGWIGARQADCEAVGNTYGAACNETVVELLLELQQRRAQTCETCASSGPEIDDDGKVWIVCGCWEFAMTPEQAYGIDGMGCHEWKEADDGGE